MKHRCTREQRLQAIADYMRGTAPKEIAEQLGVTTSAVYRWVRVGVESPCDMDCEHCRRPVDQCRGGAKKSPYTDKSQKPIRHGHESHEKNMPMLHSCGRRKG